MLSRCHLIETGNTTLDKDKEFLECFGEEFCPGTTVVIFS